MEIHRVSAVDDLHTNTDTNTIEPSWLGLLNTLSASLQKGKTPPYPVWDMIFYLPTPPLGQDMTQSQFLSGV